MTKFNALLSVFSSVRSNSSAKRASKANAPRANYSTPRPSSVQRRQIIRRN